MKYLLVLLLLSACKNDKELSTSKKRLISLSLDLRNMSVHTTFFKDSLQELQYYKTILFNARLPKDSMQDYESVHMRVFSNQWNEPYDIKKDRFLTIDKYLDYCKAHRLDPETYYKFLD